MVKKWMLLLATSYSLNSPCINKANLSALKIQKVWKNYKNNLFYFKDENNNIIAKVPVKKVKELSLILKTQTLSNFQDKNFLALDMSKEAIACLITYINSYKTANQKNIEDVVYDIVSSKKNKYLAFYLGYLLKLLGYTKALKDKDFFSMVLDFEQKMQKK